MSKGLMLADVGKLPKELADLVSKWAEMQGMTPLELVAVVGLMQHAFGHTLGHKATRDKI